MARPSPAEWSEGGLVTQATSPVKVHLISKECRDRVVELNEAESSSIGVVYLNHVPWGALSSPEIGTYHSSDL